jgi:imidazoleglycerol-phosphate dehydratase
MTEVIERVGEGGKTRVRVRVEGDGTAQVETGIPLLDHLVAVLARYASFDLDLQVAPGSALEEVGNAGSALGDALAEPLRDPGVRGHGSAAVPADEAIAHVALEASGRPLVVSNVDLSGANVAGVAGDVLASFLHRLADGAGLTLHVRLIEGRETEHVLEAIFKGLGVSLAQACRPRRRKEQADG